MTKIKAILVDDEPRGLLSLHKLLEINCPEVEVISTCSNAEEALMKIQQLQPNLVFLDIAMPGKTGFDLLKELSSISFEIIFVTAHNNYLVQAFHFSAVDYLLKPVDDDLLKAAVKRAGKRIEEKIGNPQLDIFLSNIQQRNGSQKMKLCIPSLKGFQVVEIMDIIYCEANGNYTQFHLGNRSTIVASKAIHEYEELLRDSSFVRVHKSCIINLEHVKEYIRGEGGSIILSDNTEVEVSRRKKDLFINRMKEFYKY